MGAGCRARSHSVAERLHPVKDLKSAQVPGAAISGPVAGDRAGCRPAVQQGTGAAGKVTVKRVPPAGPAGPAVMVPACASTMARVMASPGPLFGPGGEGFARLGFATSRSILAEMLDRIDAAFTAR